jgi:hypothetical protein
MNTKNVFYGVLSGALMFGALSWVTPKQTTRAAAPAHRYAITHLDGSNAMLLDASTGAVWDLQSATLCRGKSPLSLRVAGFSGCRDDEESIGPIPMFLRLSVEGVYTSPMEKFAAGLIVSGLPKPKPKQ